MRSKFYLFYQNKSATHSEGTSHSCNWEFSALRESTLLSNFWKIVLHTEVHIEQEGEAFEARDRCVIKRSGQRHAFTLLISSPISLPLIITAE